MILDLIQIALLLFLVVAQYRQHEDMLSYQTTMRLWVRRLYDRLPPRNGGKYD